jgi:hypothetical protein
LDRFCPSDFHTLPLALTGIDFASFWFFSSGQSSVFRVNLRGGSITGPILGTTPDVMGSATAGPVMFMFPGTIALTPGTRYYLQLEAVSGSATVSCGNMGQSYAGGAGYIDGQPDAFRDFWFREGIIAVPEPTSWSALTLGASFLWWHRVRRRT